MKSIFAVQLIVLPSKVVLMRIKILTTFLLTLFCLPLAWSMPSGDDSEIIRKAIDDTCGDSWCEGDYAYVFQKVNLHPEDNCTEVLSV